MGNKTGVIPKVKVIVTYLTSAKNGNVAFYGK